MSQDARIDLLLPPGRMVWGDLYEGRTENYEGRPLTFKDGSPRTSYEFGIAIPKGTEQHWAGTPWGKQIWDFGHSKWPRGQAQAPSFAWKVKDGDDRTPNKKGRVPAEMPGHAGHWIVTLGSSIAPRLFKMGPSGPVPYPDKDAIKPGDWIEVFANVASNMTDSNPGLFINHSMVCFRGYDPAGRIQVGPDPSAAGFGKASVAAGVSATPTGGSAFSAPMPATGSAPAPTVATAQPPAYAPPALAAPIPPAPPAAPAAPVMTAKAGGVPYAEFVKAGWTDEALRAEGYLA